MTNIKKHLYLLILIISMAAALNNKTVYASEIFTLNTGQAVSSIHMSVSNLDNSGQYVYKGIDMAIFEGSTLSGTFTVKTDKVKRILQNSTEFDINLGSLAEYDESKYYKIAYRILYTRINSEEIVIQSYNNGKEGWILLQNGGEDLYFITKDEIPPANPVISINPTSVTSGNVTVTITYPSDAVIKSYNINGGTSSSYTGAFTVSNNCTINAACADASGNWSEEVSYVITNIHIYPTLNTPTISGAIYLGEDITLTDTGTNIAQAAYRVYYTTNVSAPIITDGAENSGIDWLDSGLSGTMTVTGGTGLSKIIAGASLSNNNWTYVTFKVWAASPTNDSVTKYSQAYVVSNDGNSAINYVGHNQIIKIFNTNTDVVVSDPDTPVEAYNPDPTSVGYLDQNNLFENQNPFMKYRLEFDVLKPQIVKDIEIDFDFNYYNDYWIEFRPKTMILEKLNNDGTVAGILQTYDINGVSYTKQSTNRYILRLGNDNEGNPIIQANGQGRYAVEYRGELIVQTDNRAGTVLMRHNAEMYIFTTTSIYPDTLEAQRPSRKFYIDTKVTKFDVRYH